MTKGKAKTFLHLQCLQSGHKVVSLESKVLKLKTLLLRAEVGTVTSYALVEFFQVFSYG